MIQQPGIEIKPEAEAVVLIVSTMRQSEKSILRKDQRTITYQKEE